MCLVESKGGETENFESARCPTAQPGTTKLGQNARSHANTTIGHQNAMLGPLPLLWGNIPWYRHSMPTGHKSHRVPATREPRVRHPHWEGLVGATWLPMGLYILPLSQNDPPTTAQGSMGVVGGHPKIAESSALLPYVSMVQRGRKGRNGRVGPNIAAVRTEL